MIRDLTSLTLTATVGSLWNGIIGGGVTGGDTVVRLNLRRLIIIVVVWMVTVDNRLVVGEIVHTGALPHGINFDPHPEQHNLATAHGGGRRLAALRHLIGWDRIGVFLQGMEC